MTETTAFTAEQLRNFDAAIQAAYAACPFPTGSDAWHTYFGYLENASEPDSLQFYIDSSAAYLVDAATEEANSRW